MRNITRYLLDAWTGQNSDLKLRKYFAPKPATFAIKSNKKPEWVKHKVIYLKAINPELGCRKIAELFNRIHLIKDAETVSKSYVYLQLKNHQYQWRALRRKLKHKRPSNVPINTCWGVDLTTVTDKNSIQHTLLAVVDYGSRKCLSLRPINSKHSLVLLIHLLKLFTQFGTPKRIKTDNEAVFKSQLFQSIIKLIGVKQQFSEIACPWMNGRIERKIGTFKERINKLTIDNQLHLEHLLPDYIYWYNVVRPHSHLDGRTPMEVWQQVDVFKTGYKHAKHFEKWGGLLTGVELIY
ncbi:integrase core domain-containing protein [Alteromonas sp. a30]|uniref:integrase core domain-containing protein n=1 Tax=Alteromonas sp. a30 TaxID=2730917 RepID=UPI0022822397|nr:integrase core domain-containing protein [Alteromonas sp. a30]MCY7297494.1 transposase [Alteromonas sp. a30]